jgi:hypothetical protein
MASRSTIIERIPTTMPGVMPLNGKRKPVRLVKTVVTRNSAVTAGTRLAPIMATITKNPAAMAIRLIATCR